MEEYGRRRVNRTFSNVDRRARQLGYQLVKSPESPGSVNGVESMAWGCFAQEPSECGFAYTRSLGPFNWTLLTRCLFHVYGRTNPQEPAGLGRIGPEFTARATHITDSMPPDRQPTLDSRNIRDGYPFLSLPRA